MKTLMEQWLEDNHIEKEEGLISGYSWFGKDIITLSQETDGLRNLRRYRDEAIAQFSFAILTEQTIQALLPHGPFLEVGAGTGYWAWELQRAGADVVAIDPHPYHKLSVKPEKTYGEVLNATAKEAILKHGKTRTLLTVWPDMDTWANKALRQYQVIDGQKVIYVGEGHGGCTADDRFHELLDENWEVLEEIPLENWSCIHDHCTVHVRKDKEKGKE